MPFNMLSTHNYMDLLVVVVFLILSAYWPQASLVWKIQESYMDACFKYYVQHIAIYLLSED